MAQQCRVLAALGDNPGLSGNIVYSSMLLVERMKRCVARPFGTMREEEFANNRSFIGTSGAIRRATPPSHTATAPAQGCQASREAKTRCPWAFPSEPPLSWLPHANAHPQRCRGQVIAQNCAAHNAFWVIASSLMCRCRARNSVNNEGWCEARDSVRVQLREVQRRLAENAQRWACALANACRYHPLGCRIGRRGRERDTGNGCGGRIGGGHRRCG